MNGINYEDFLCKKAESAVLVIDMQPGFKPIIPAFDQITERIKLLLSAANILNIPAYGSEQYPVGLGETLEEIKNAAGPMFGAFSKQEFSAACVDNWNQVPQNVREAPQIVVVGIEAHVCVRHTVMDLLKQGKTVHICTDAVASSQEFLAQISVRELIRAGAHESSVQQVIFDWLRKAGTSEFKKIQTMMIS